MTRFSGFMVLVAWMAWSVRGAELPMPNGLVATATDGQTKVSFVCATPNFSLTNTQSIHPRLQTAFTVEWTGCLAIPREGSYTLRGQAKILLDGQEVQDKAVNLTAGKHPLKIEFARKPGMDRLQLTWQSDFFKPEPIPYTAFYHKEALPTLAADEAIEAGRQLAGELNCAACHSDASQANPWKGPTLTGIGSRVTQAWIYQWLADPKKFQTNAVMPALLENDTDRADVAAYLAGLKQAAPPADVPATSAGSLKQGKELYDTIGCTACHNDANWPLLGMGSKWSLAALAAFLEKPLDYDPSGRMPDLALTKEEARVIASHLLQSTNPAFATPAPAGRVEAGKSLVQSSGCLNCHALEAPASIDTTLQAPAWAKLQAGRGCLAPKPGGKAARFGLPESSLQNLTALLKAPAASAAPLQEFQRRLNYFQCQTCHAWQGVARAFFPKSPPPLTESGEKLRASWLQQVFNQNKRIRPWLALRMPTFGEASMKPMIPLFAAQAGTDSGEGEPFPKGTAQTGEPGMKLIGRSEGGLSCVNCHDFRGEKAQAEMRGPDMVQMGARLRADWVKRWWRDPGRHVPGTAMPAFFSELPSAQAETMMDQLLNALSLGGDMPNPAGLASAAQSYVLKVTDKPVIMRCFLPAASPRSIAVGLPGRQAYCFDAAACRLRFAWKGEFLDMQPTWSERGGLPPKVMGAIYYTPVDVFPIRLGNPREEPAVKFLGYQLVNDLPEFYYTANGIKVTERIATATGASGIIRSFQLGPVKSDFWFIIGDPGDLKISCTAGPIENGRVKIPGGENVRFELKITEPAKNYE